MTVVPDRLLDEVERQRQYLDDLPPGFQYPLFNARQALESQRDSGYVNTASAAREIVDNAIEAGAERIHIVFETGMRHTRKVVTNIAFIDDGSGMLPEMARFALMWGGGTHFKEPGLIGKFGFGLPNASINQARRVDVYTRTAGQPRFAHVRLDVDAFGDYEQQSVPRPESSPLPRFVATYLKRNNMSLDHGTVVVWHRPDRLTYRTPANLKEHLLDDFGVVYRYVLGVEETSPGVELVVEGVEVAPIDPLFLLPSGRFYEPEPKGAVKMADHRIPVRYWEDEDTLARHLLHADEEPAESENWRLITESVIEVRIARFPVGFLEDRGRRRGSKRPENLRFDVRRERRGISFVRGLREIQTLDRFPPASRENVAQGLGRWPSIQAYAYHWACEIRFPLELDEPFGISNNKQAVRPTEDLWKVLVGAEIDAELRAENQWQSQQRARKPAKEKTGPTPAEIAASDADKATARQVTTPRWARAAAAEALKREAARRAEESEISLLAALKQLKAEAQVRRYRVDYHDQEDGPLYRPEWQGDQIVVLINRRHPFYDEIYSAAFEDTRVKEGFDLLFIALAKGELQADDKQFHLWYRDQRVQVWSRFLDSAAGWLAARLEPDEEDDDDDAE